MIRKFPQWLVVGALVLATGVIVPLLRAKRVFAPHTPLAFAASAARPSLRRRAGGRRVASPRQSVAPRESVAPQSNASALAVRDAGEFPKGGGDVPLPRGRRVGVGGTGDESGVRTTSLQPAPPGPDSTDLPGDYVSTERVEFCARPAPSVALSAVSQLIVTSRDAADVPAPPPKPFTC